MLKVTNNTTEFFEKEDGDIIIYGAGNAGYWVGYYMNRCGINFECYVDKNIWHEKIYLLEKPVYKPDELFRFKGEKVRIIITAKNQDSVLAKLLELEQRYSINAICLTPLYPSINRPDKIKRYNINKFLGYFRKKLLKAPLPTVLSNDCTGGLFYDIMDSIMLSPLINTAIMSEDFVKICKNPQYYLNADLREPHYTVFCFPPGSHEESISYRLNDIVISFGHIPENEEGNIEKRWEIMKKYINWNRLIYIMVDKHGMIPFRTFNEFQELEGEKMIMIKDTKSLYLLNETIHCFYDAAGCFFQRDDPIENHFDIVGWLNKEYC